MTITFTSRIIGDDDKENKFHFTSSVKISDWNEFKVYEFNEPSKNELNRIEVGETNINIFAGPSTLNLTLGEDKEIFYETPHGVISFISRLHSLENKGKEINMHYSLSNSKKKVGDYHISLKIDD